MLASYLLSTTTILLAELDDIIEFTSSDAREVYVTIIRSVGARFFRCVIEQKVAFVRGEILYSYRISPGILQLQSYIMNRQHQNQIALPSISDMGVLVVRGITSFAKRHKVLSGSYILGLIFLVLIGSGTKLTLDQRQHYNSIMNTIDQRAEYEASQNYAQTYQAYRYSKGWFSCDSLCKRNKLRMDGSKATLEEIRKEGYKRMSDAKSVAGVFSEIGVEEMSDSFWEYFGAGKRFAKRQSMWDALYVNSNGAIMFQIFSDYVFKCT